MAQEQRLPLPPLTKKRRSLIPLSMDLAMSDDDMLTEILLRLPAKSLARFKSVCRRWRIIISSPYLHTLLCAKLQPSLILQIGFDRYLSQTINGEKTIIPYNMGTSLPKYKIMQACNGLMLLFSKNSGFDPTAAHDFSCCYGFSRTVGYADCIDRYYVYNPTTRQSREISMSVTPDQKSKYRPRVEAIVLAFDPLKSPYYKIVCIRCGPRDSYQIEVYDSESHNWMVSLEVVVTSSSTTSFLFPEYWNNSIYFISKEGYCIFYIDKNEMTTTLPFPQTPDDIGIVDHGDQGLIKTFASFHFQESDGRLYLIKSISEYLRGKPAAESVVVWELGGEDDSQWLYKYHHRDDERMNTNIVRLMVGPDGDKTCSLLTNKVGKIGAFDIINKTYEDLFDLGTRSGFVSGFQFGESLALV